MNISQEDFEKMFHDKTEESPYKKGWIVYFTAAWCAPCKNINHEAVESTALVKGIPYWKCDETINSYTSGYCNVRKFPTFVYFKPKQTASTLQSADTDQIVSWITKLE
jgi:hypothetical protein